MADFRMTVVENRFPELMKKSPILAGKAVRKVTFDVQRKAMKDCPVDTGFLKNSIHVSFANSGMTGIINVGAFYGIHVNFGTRSMAARPFMSEAVAVGRTEFSRAMEEAFKGLGK